MATTGMRSPTASLARTWLHQKSTRALVDAQPGPHHACGPTWPAAAFDASSSGPSGHSSPTPLASHPRLPSCRPSTPSRRSHRTFLCGLPLRETAHERHKSPTKLQPTLPTVTDRVTTALPLGFGNIGGKKGSTHHPYACALSGATASPSSRTRRIHAMSKTQGTIPELFLVLRGRRGQRAGHGDPWLAKGLGPDIPRIWFPTTSSVPSTARDGTAPLGRRIRQGRSSRRTSTKQPARMISSSNQCPLCERMGSTPRQRMPR